MRRGNAKRVGLVLFVLLTMLVGVVAQVNAAFISCRSDPIIFLSDGTKLQVATVVETSQDDLIHIRFEVHAPAGVTVNRVIYTPRWASTKESVVIVNDQPAGSYQIWTTVTTGTPNVTVTVKSMAFIPRRNGGQGLQRQSLPGLSGQVIVLAY